MAGAATAWPDPASGIGAGLSREAARSGYRVLLADLNERALARTAAEIPGAEYLVTGQWWVGVFPGIALILMVQRANFRNSDDSPVRLAFTQAAMRGK